LLSDLSVLLLSQNVHYIFGMCQPCIAECDDLQTQTFMLQASKPCWLYLEQHAFLFKMFYLFKPITVRPRLSKLGLTGIPAIWHKTARNGFLSMHFTPLIRKPHCLTLTKNLGTDMPNQ